MNAIESKVDAGRPAHEVVTLSTPWHALWRPWYMKLWWCSTMTWNVAQFSVVGTDTIPGAWVFTFLFHPLAPLIPFSYRQLASWREEVTFPWDSGCLEGFEPDERPIAPPLLDEYEIAERDSFSLTDPTDPRSGVMWIGHPLNLLNRHD